MVTNTFRSRMFLNVRYSTWYTDICTKLLSKTENGSNEIARAINFTDNTREEKTFTAAI